MSEKTSDVANDCPGFYRIGQPITSCTNCGQPAWDHDFDMQSGGSPFSELMPVAWSEEMTAAWERRGWVAAERAQEMRRLDPLHHRGH